MSSTALVDSMLEGMWAVQLGLISYDEFIAAVNIWTQIKQEPLLSGFVRQSSLSEAEWERHLSDSFGLHDGPTIDYFSEKARLEFASMLRPNPDPEIQQIVAMLDPKSGSYTEKSTIISECESATGMLRQSVAIKRDWPEPIFVAGRFAAVREIGGEGMGTIYVGYERDEIGRVVILKTVTERQGVDLKHLYWRLRREGEILSQLEHPNIIPMYGTGSMESGAPYIAMQFLRKGELRQAIRNFHYARPLISLQESGPFSNDQGGDSWIEKPPVKATIPKSPTVSEFAIDKGMASSLKYRSLHGESLKDFYDLLRRFTDVCNAIEYAHNRGVLHHDIKPSNVMIGNHGETLVIDWGLAGPLTIQNARKCEESPVVTSESHTVESNYNFERQAPGTLPYMSPEQLRGDIDKIDRRTDVFALGVMLYEILTGELPFQKVLLETASQPHRVQRMQFHKAICSGLSNSRIKPLGVPPPLIAICAKAMAFEQDLRYKTSRELSDDVNRWLADGPVEAYRNQESWIEKSGRWARKNRGLASALIAATIFLAVSGLLFNLMQANFYRDIALARDRADANSVQATKQRARAMNREELAIEAIKKFATAVTDNNQLKQRPELESLRKDLILSPVLFFQKLTDVVRTEDTQPENLNLLAESLHQLGVLIGEVDDVLQAERAFVEAVLIGRRLVLSEPDSVRIRSNLAKYLTALGLQEARSGKFMNAKANYFEAIAIHRFLVKQSPTESEFGANLATSLNLLGSLQYEMGDLSLAKNNFLQSISVAKACLMERQDAAKIRYGIAGTLSNLASLKCDTGDYAGARSDYQMAFELQEELAASYPDNFEYEQRLIVILSNLAILEYDNGNYSDARVHIESATRRGDELVKKNPAVAELRSDLVRSYENFAKCCRKHLEFEESRQLCRRAIEFGEQLVDQYPTLHKYKAQLASSLTILSMIEEDSGDMDLAREYRLQAVGLEKELYQELPNVPERKSNLAGSLNNLARIDADADRAMELLYQAIELQSQALETNNKNPQFLRFMLNHWLNVTEVLPKVKDPESGFNHAISVIKVLVTKHPDSKEFGGIQCDLQNAYSWWLAAIPNRESDKYQKAIVLAKGCLLNSPSDGGLLNTLGVAQYRAGEFEESVVTLTRSLGLNTDAVNGFEEPSDLAFLAMAQWMLGRSSDAKKNIERLFEVMKHSDFRDAPDSVEFFNEAKLLILNDGAPS